MARETWATRTGFILAAVGSAVGLGNIWRFPFITGQYGGSSFLITYLAFVALIGFPAILVEFVIGRRTDRNPVGALRELGSGGWSYAGWLFVVTGFIILSYYSVVAGWFLRYTLIGITEGFTLTDPAEANALFGDGLDRPRHASVPRRVHAARHRHHRRRRQARHRAEREGHGPRDRGAASRAGRVRVHARRRERGVQLHLSPDFGTIAANWTEILPAAAGQAFFTLSVGMGVMITYASYLGEDRNLAADAGIIAALDTLVAVLVGFVVFPILFSVGIEPHGRSRRDFREPHRGVRRYPWWSDPRRRFLRDGRNCRASRRRSASWRCSSRT